MIAATIVGNLGADAELKYLQDGTAVIELRVASNGREKVGGDWKDVPTWVRVSLFGKRAESLGKLGLTKGIKIAARGVLKLRDWESKDGRKGSSLEMRADDVELMSAGAPAAALRSPVAPAQGGQQHANDLGGGGADDDIPF